MGVKLPQDIIQDERIAFINLTRLRKPHRIPRITYDGGILH